MKRTALSLGVATRSSWLSLRYWSDPRMYCETLIDLTPGEVDIGEEEP